MQNERVFNFYPANENKNVFVAKMECLLRPAEKQLDEAQIFFESVCESLPERFYDVVPCLKYLYYKEAVDVAERTIKNVNINLITAKTKPMLINLQTKTEAVADVVFYMGKCFWERHFPKIKPEDFVTQCNIVATLAGAVSKR